MFGNLSTRDEPYFSKLDNVHYRPVFILGFHRSGTTLLYELMAMTGSFKIITTYHVLYYDELLANHFEGTADQAHQELNDWFASLNIKTR
ncbi:MAG: sulfotransferase, partial [Promethearchaeota archaeon]